MIILPSLEIVPAKYNTSTNTLLSQIPIDGTGDFTVTRATSATRVNGNGLIEVARTNLALQSENFLTTWSQNNVSVTGNVTGTTDPFGGNTASQIFETATSGTHFLAQTMTIVSGQTYAGSVFLKKAAGSPDWMQVAFSTTGLAGFANFNLTSGTVGNVGAGCTGRIENYGNGWYRCTLVQTATANGTSGGPVIVFINNTNIATRYLSYAGNTATSIYVWGAQLEESSSASEYIPTTTVARTTFAGVTVDGTAAANIPRLDYLQPDGTIGCPALLVEPSATNLVPNGTAFNTVTDLSFTNSSDSPASSISGTLITKITGATGGVFAQQTCLTSLPSGSTTYTISRFFKYNGTDLTTSLSSNVSTQWGGTNWIQQVVISAASGVTLGTSTNCTGSVENYGNGWYRVSARLTTGASPSGSTTVQYLMIVAGSVASGSSFLTALPQLEVGSVATSYIPTTVSGVARAADVIRDTTASGVIGQTEGTIYVEAYIRKISDAIVVAIMNTGIADALYLQVQPNGDLVARIRNSGSIVDISIAAANWSEGYHKVAIAYGAGTGNSAICIDGRTPVTGTIVNIPACKTMILGSRPDVPGTLSLTDRIRAAALYPTRLTNTQLALLTSPYTSYSSMASALSYTLG